MMEGGGELLTIWRVNYEVSFAIQNPGSLVDGGPRGIFGKNTRVQIEKEENKKCSLKV